MKMRKLGLLAALIIPLGILGLVNAETIKKLHTAPQLLFNTDIADNTDATLGALAVIDLDGGNLDKCSFQVKTTSGTSGDTMALDIQISADGGTTWVSVPAANQPPTISTWTVAVSCHIPNVPVNPGTKLRIIPTLSSSATFYDVKIWAMPSVD